MGKHKHTKLFGWKNTLDWFKELTVINYDGQFIYAKRSLCILRWSTTISHVTRIDVFIPQMLQQQIDGSVAMLPLWRKMIRLLATDKPAKLSGTHISLRNQKVYLKWYLLTGITCKQIHCLTRCSWDLVSVRSETGTLFQRRESLDSVKASHVVLEFDETAENDKTVCFAWGPLSNSPSDSSVVKLCHTRYSFVLSWVRRGGAIQGSVTIIEDEIEFINYFFTTIKLITRQSEYNYPTLPFKT